MIKLLIVDDSALMRKLLGNLFREEGDFEVTVARDGAEALERVRADPPDVVTMDVAMPGMDGLTCLNSLMVEAPRPVIMVSALTRAGAEATLQAMDLGAVDVVAKPDGTPSLAIDEFGPALVAKVRAAVGAKPRLSRHLRARVRHTITQGLSSRPAGGAARAAVVPPPKAQAPAAHEEGSGGAPEGLVVIGSSTGGPQALEVVLAALPADFTWAVAVTQHMPGHFTGAFARRLDATVAMRVVEVDRPTPLAAGHVYIANGDGDMLIARRPAGPVALPAPASADFRWHPSTDRLAASALEALAGPRLIGVLLTGMGEDGAAAMTELHAAGGHTIAESEETAVVWGMPGELVRQGGADTVLPLDAIGPAIVAAATRRGTGRHPCP